MPIDLFLCRLGLNENIETTKAHFIYDLRSLRDFVFSLRGELGLVGFNKLGDEKLVKDFLWGESRARLLYSDANLSNVTEEIERLYGPEGWSVAYKQSVNQQIVTALPEHTSVAQVLVICEKYHQNINALLRNIKKDLLELRRSANRPVDKKQARNVDIKTFVDKFESPFVLSDNEAIVKVLLDEKFVRAKDLSGITDDELTQIGINKKADRIVLLHQISSLPIPKRTGT